MGVLLGTLILSAAGQFGEVQINNRSVEASELLENFLWKQPQDADITKIKEELADVLAYALLIAKHYDLNVEDIVLDKIAKNALKYPADKAKGSAKKYTEL